MPKGRVEGPALGTARSSRHGPRLVGLRPRADDGKKPAAVMVFQDGHKYVNTRRRPRPDRLRQPDPQGGDARDRRPLRQPRQQLASIPREPLARSNRCIEYDALGRPVRAVPGRRDGPGGREARQVTQRPRATRDLAARAPAASAPSPPPGTGPTTSARSSATSAASRTSAAAMSTRAHPQAEPSKPMRVFLQDGSNDLDNLGATGRWPTRRWPRPSSSAGYDHRFGSGTAATPASTAARSSPTPCAGSGGTSARGIPP